MNAYEYTLLQTQLTALAGIVRQLPLEAFIARAELAQAACRVFDQTSPRLEELTRMAEGLLAFQRALPPPSQVELVTFGQMRVLPSEQLIESCQRSLAESETPK